jgi:hypothetical protein
MPIVIDEVVISVDVGDTATDSAVLAPTATCDRQALIDECVERVLEILRLRDEPCCGRRAPASGGEP